MTAQERNEEIMAGEVPTREVLTEFLRDMANSRRATLVTREIAYRHYCRLIGREFDFRAHPDSYTP